MPRSFHQPATRLVHQQSRERAKEVSIGNLLKKILAGATGKGTSHSGSSTGLQSILCKPVSFDPLLDSPFSNWLTRVDLLAPSNKSRSSVLAVKTIIRTLNAKQDADLSNYRMKLSVPDVVEVLKALNTPACVFTFYKWIRTRHYFIPDKAIYGAIFKRLTMGETLPLDKCELLDVLLEDMVREKIALNNEQFEILLALGCGSLSKQVDGVTRLHWYVDWFLKMRQVGFLPPVSTHEKLMRLCNNCQMYVGTLLLFEDIPTKTYPWAFNMALTACKRLNKLAIAGKILDEMKAKGATLDLKCYTTILGLCTNQSHADKVDKLYEQMKQLGVPLDLMACTSLINAYARVGSVAGAEKVFRSVEMKLDHGICRAMVACYRAAGKFDQMLALLREAEMKRCRVGPSTYEQAFQACVERKEWASAVQTIKDMQAGRMSPSPRLYHSILRACKMLNDIGACNTLVFDIQRMEMQSQEEFESAIDIFLSLERLSYAIDAFKLMRARQLEWPSAHVYEQMIQKFLSSCLSDAMIMYDDMRAAGYVPSVQMFASLIKEHVKIDDFVQGKKIYNDMLLAGLDPGELLTCISQEGGGP